MTKRSDDDDERTNMDDLDEMKIKRGCSVPIRLTECWGMCLQLHRRIRGSPFSKRREERRSFWVHALAWCWNTFNVNITKSTWRMRWWRWLLIEAYNPIIAIYFINCLSYFTCFYRLVYWIHKTIQEKGSPKNSLVLQQLQGSQSKFQLWIDCQFDYIIIMFGGILYFPVTLDQYYCIILKLIS